MTRIGMRRGALAGPDLPVGAGPVAELDCATAVPATAARSMAAYHLFMAAPDMPAGIAVMVTKGNLPFHG
jgi:hypothetical protein